MVKLYECARETVQVPSISTENSTLKLIRKSMGCFLSLAEQNRNNIQQIQKEKSESETCRVCYNWLLLFALAATAGAVSAMWFGCQQAGIVAINCVSFLAFNNKEQENIVQFYAHYSIFNHIEAGVVLLDIIKHCMCWVSSISFESPVCWGFQTCILWKDEKK